MKENLDQRRARFAWERVQNQTKDYANLAKGAPALIMTSGLMPLLAYLKDKGNNHHKDLLEHLCKWLHLRFPHDIKQDSFTIVMESLMGNDQGHAAKHANFYRQATEEALAILRWIRQFGAVVNTQS